MDPDVNANDWQDASGSTGVQFIPFTNYIQNTASTSTCQPGWIETESYCDQTDQLGSISYTNDLPIDDFPLLDYRRMLAEANPTSQYEYSQFAVDPELLKLNIFGLDSEIVETTNRTVVGYCLDIHGTMDRLSSPVDGNPPDNGPLLGYVLHSNEVWPLYPNKNVPPENVPLLFLYVLPRFHLGHLIYDLNNPKNCIVLYRHSLEQTRDVGDVIEKYGTFTIMDCRVDLYKFQYGDLRVHLTPTCLHRMLELMGDPPLHLDTLCLSTNTRALPMQIKGKNRAQDTVEQEIKDNLDNLPDAGEDAEEAEDDDEDKSTLHGSKRYEVKWMKEWTPVLHRVVERAKKNMCYKAVSCQIALFEKKRHHDVAVRASYEYAMANEISAVETSVTIQGDTAPISVHRVLGSIARIIPDFLTNLYRAATKVAKCEDGYDIKSPEDALHLIMKPDYSFTDGVNNKPFGHAGIKLMTDHVLMFKMDGDQNLKTMRPLKHEIIVFSSTIMYIAIARIAGDQYDRNYDVHRINIFQKSNRLCNGPHASDAYKALLNWPIPSKPHKKKPTVKEGGIIKPR